MWYSACLLHKSKRVGTTAVKEPLWEESIVLVEAKDEKDAFEKAVTMGKQREVQYVAADGYSVSWTFERVSRMCELLADRFVHGTEVFSRFLDESQVSAIVDKSG